jgi:hypothetical protein
MVSRLAGPPNASKLSAEEYGAGDQFVLTGMVTVHSVDEWTELVRG